MTRIRLQPGDVRARAADYTVDYDYVANTGVRLLWERRGTWTAQHGSQGWLLDGDSWNSVHITGLIYKDGTQVAVTDRVFPDGHHTYDLPSLGTYSFTATNSSWQTQPVATPTPAMAEQPAQLYNPPPAYAPPPGYTVPSMNCEDVSVSDIYDDGSILELDDGRRLHVADYDTPTSSVWVAPFDAMICGDRFVNKDDNDAVDLSP